jgi:hypothetical protein
MFNDVRAALVFLWAAAATPDNRTYDMSNSIPQLELLMRSNGLQRDL